ncbi:MAG: hypothetical protein ACOCP8_02665 [archaeon]
MAAHIPIVKDNEKVNINIYSSIALHRATDNIINQFAKGNIKGKI